MDVQELLRHAELRKGHGIVLPTPPACAALLERARADGIQVGALFVVSSPLVSWSQGGVSRETGDLWLYYSAQQEDGEQDLQRGLLLLLAHVRLRHRRALSIDEDFATERAVWEEAGRLAQDWQMQDVLPDERLAARIEEIERTREYVEAAAALVGSRDPSVARAAYMAIRQLSARNEWDEQTLEDALFGICEDARANGLVLDFDRTQLRAEWSQSFAKGGDFGLLSLPQDEHSVRILRSALERVTRRWGNTLEPPVRWTERQYFSGPLRLCQLHINGEEDLARALGLLNFLLLDEAAQIGSAQATWWAYGGNGEGVPLMEMGVDGAARMYRLNIRYRASMDSPSSEDVAPETEVWLLFNARRGRDYWHEAALQRYIRSWLATKWQGLRCETLAEGMSMLWSLMALESAKKPAPASTWLVVLVHGGGKADRAVAEAFGARIAGAEVLLANMDHGLLPVHFWQEHHQRIGRIYLFISPEFYEEYLEDERDDQWKRFWQDTLALHHLCTPVFMGIEQARVRGAFTHWFESVSLYEETVADPARAAQSIVEQVEEFERQRAGLSSASRGMQRQRGILRHMLSYLDTLLRAPYQAGEFPPPGTAMERALLASASLLAPSDQGELAAWVGNECLALCDALVHLTREAALRLAVVRSHPEVARYVGMLQAILEEKAAVLRGALLVFARDAAEPANEGEWTPMREGTVVYTHDGGTYRVQIDLYGHAHLEAGASVATMGGIEAALVALRSEPVGEDPYSTRYWGNVEVGEGQVLHVVGNSPYRLLAPGWYLALQGALVSLFEDFWEDPVAPLVARYCAGDITPRRLISAVGWEKKRIGQERERALQGTAAS